MLTAPYGRGDLTQIPAMNLRRLLHPAAALLAAFFLSPTAPAAAVSSLGQDGWYADDNRGSTGADLVGATLTHYPKAGQTPTAADDTAIRAQVGFVAAYQGRGALMLSKSGPGFSKSQVSKVNPAGYVSGDWRTGFSLAYDYATTSTAELPVPKLGIRSALWGTGAGESQAAFSAVRSGESAWDLVLVDWRGTDPGWVTTGNWASFTTTASTVCWKIYRQAGNAFFNPTPAATLSLNDIAAMNNPSNPAHVAKVVGPTTYTWADVIFGAAAKVASVQIGVGSSAQTSVGYIDFVNLSLLGGIVDFGGVMHVNGTTGSDLTGDGSEGNPYQTISKAVAEAPSGTVIEVAAGTYPEQVAFTGKELTIRGAGASTVILAPAALGSQSYTRPDATAGTAVAILFVENGSLTLEDLVVDGSGHGYTFAPQTFTGVMLASSDGALKNVVVREIDDHPASGMQNGFGVRAYDAVGGKEVVIEDSTFQQIQKQDGTFWGQVADPIMLTITDTAFEGVGPIPYIAQNALVIFEGVTAVITNCSFTGYNYTGAYWGSTAVYNVGANVTVNTSLFSGNDYAVYNEDDSVAGMLSLTGNSFAGNQYALVNTGTNGVTGSGNWFGSVLGPVLEPTTSLVYSTAGDQIYNDGGPVVLGAPAAKPAFADSLYLEPTTASLFIKPTEVATIAMKVANLTQAVVGLDALMNFSSTYFQTSGGGSPVVAPGGGVWSELIYDSWTSGGDLDVSVGLSFSTPATTADATTATVALTANGVEGTTQVVFRPASGPFETQLATAIGGSVIPVTVDSANIVIDGTAPVVSATAEQASVEVTDGTVVAGTVEIAVEAEDALAGLADNPTVGISGPSGYTATFVNESPAGVFNYTWVVTPTTPNGLYTVNVEATDRSGNAGSDSFTLSVNKNKITGTISLEGFVGSSRMVRFVATNGSGTVLKTWDLLVTGFSLGSASFELTEVPSAIARLSAKTDWNLRRRLPVTLDSFGQGVVAFTGSSNLKGGDLNNTNTVNALDYAILKANWLTTNAVADVTGNGVVNALDYAPMKANYFTAGDPE